MQANVPNTAIIRIEQLYPLDTDSIRKIISEYSKVCSFLWVQEEPKNSGAWGFMNEFLSPLLPRGETLTYVGRRRAASPATGRHALHVKEGAEIIETLRTLGTSDASRT
jgi:2-oxoglutarate dehydrogenase E1 component